MSFLASFLALDVCFKLRRTSPFFYGMVFVRKKGIKKEGLEHLMKGACSSIEFKASSCVRTQPFPSLSPAWEGFGCGWEREHPSFLEIPTIRAIRWEETSRHGGQVYQRFPVHSQKKECIIEKERHRSLNSNTKKRISARGSERTLFRS